MKRYWASWWSEYSVQAGCTKPPFPVWISGYRCRDDSDEYNDCSICAVVDAESEVALWEMVTKHFPDYEPRFCNETEADWEPGGRFPKGTPDA